MSYENLMISLTFIDYTYTYIYAQLNAIEHCYFTGFFCWNHCRRRATLSRPVICLFYALKCFFYHMIRLGAWDINQKIKKKKKKNEEN